MTVLNCHIIAHNSPEYDKTIQLRYHILREPLGLQFTPEQLDVEADHIHLAGYVGDQLAACLVLVPESHGNIKMRQVAVDTRWQGQGLGKQLIRFAEEWSAARGFTLMHCHARETAVPFYLSMGYVIRGERFEEVTIPHFYMEKYLTHIT